MPGGKQKQAQRTKGNAKPSSSARAAELLASASGGSGTLGFVGFGAMSDLGYVPAAGALEDTDNSMDSDFRLVLRKLSKRDATTKLKALQELSVLCKEKDAESIKTVLPFWPRIYNKVAIDHDRRVREATQQAFEQLVLRVRRNLAPHLRSLMGTWLIAQCDMYAPAASAAKLAFQAAFPPSKQTESYVYCKDDILTHLHENLFVHTANSLGDPKLTEPEDIEAKYHRVLCASLGALKMFLGTVPIEQQNSLQEKYRTMLNDNKFWKYAKHSQPSIVGAFHSVLAGFCQYQPDLVRDFSSKLCPVVLHNLDNTEPLVCGPLWETALYILSTITDCWQHVNPRKGVLPRLWTLLKQGGGGNATVIFPNLLPFLSHIPQEVIGDSAEFYKEFFSHMKTGMSEEKVTGSPSECNAVVKAFMECLRFCLTRNMDDTKITACLLQDQFLPVLGASILETSSPLPTTPLFSMTADLLTYIHKLSSTDENKDLAKSATNSLTETIQEIADLRVVDADNEIALKRFTLFLQTFKNNKHAAEITVSKVKFAEPDQKGIINKSPMESVKMSDSPLIMNEGPVFRLVCDACREAYIISKDRKSVPHLTFIAQLMKTYMPENPVRQIFPEAGNTGILGVLEQVVNPWIDVFDQSCKSPSKIQGGFVDILMVLFDLCPLEERTALLSASMKSISNMAVFQQFVKQVYNQNSDQTVTAWFKGDEFGYKMVAVAKHLCEQSLGDEMVAIDDQIGDSEPGESIEQKWQMLSLAFSVGDDLEPLLGERYLSDILKEILHALPTPTSMATLSQSHINKCVSFVCDVAINFFSNVKGCLLLPPAEELLLCIFQVFCQSHDSSTGGGMLEKLSRAWQQGVVALLAQRGGLINDGGFFQRATSHIKHLVETETHTMRRLDSLVSVSLSLVSCVGQGLSGSEDPHPLCHVTARALLRELYMPFLHASITQWKAAPLVRHELTFSSCDSDSESKKAINENQIPTCVAPTVFTSHLIAALVSPVTEEESTDDSVDNDLILEIVYGIVYCGAILSPESLVLGQTDLSKCCIKSKENIVTILSNLPSNQLHLLLKQAIDKSLEQGQLWALALRHLMSHLKKLITDPDILELAGGLDRFSELDEGSLNTLQVLLPHLKPYTVRNIVDIQAALTLTCTVNSITSIQGVLGHLSVLSACLDLQEPVLVSGADPDYYCISIDSLIGVLDVVMVWRDQHDHLFLFDNCIKSESWAVVAFNQEVIHFLMSLINKMPAKLTDKHWDFVLCSLVAWIQSCNESKADLINDTKTQAFASLVFDLLTETSLCMKNIAPERTDVFPPNLLTEWMEFFSEGAYSLLVPLFVELADHNIDTCLSLVVRSLSSAISLCPLTHLQKHHLPAKLVAGDDSSLPDSHQTALNQLCPLLLSGSRSVQLGAYRLLNCLMPDLPQYDETPREQEEDQDNPTRSPPHALLSVLETTSQGVELLLHDVNIEEPIHIEPTGAEYTVTMAYLLSWRLLLTFIVSAKVELRAKYSSHIRDQQLMEQLMVNLFKLMPHSPVVTLTDSLTTHSPSQKLSPSRNLFAQEPLLSTKGIGSSEEVQHLSCLVYFRALQEFPALLRQWYNSQDKKTSAVVNKYTTKYVSPLLCTEEISAINKSDVTMDNMQIKTRPATREVVAMYNVDEVSIELVVTLPSSHPLGPITVECGRRIGVANTQWRNWMLQLNTYLHRQNGTILDGLMMWKRNVDKRFEGVEECMICFAVIHGYNFQVPKLQCKTCKKRFHSACLYKWFNTSNNSTCPLCRNLF